MERFVYILLSSIIISSSLFFFIPEIIRSNVVNIISDDINKKDISRSPYKEPLDFVDYDLRSEKLANNPVPKIIQPKVDPNTGEVIPAPLPDPNLWPVKTVYPNAGAILPFHRIVAYYGNLYSTKMGVLGQYEENEMIARLQAEVEKWNLADPETPVIPALHYIAVVAQLGAGEDGKYRARMPESEIEKVLKIAEKMNAIVFLDVQVGLSDLESEIPRLEKFLKLPNVHLGIDAEFSMKTGARPGKVVGTFDAVDINFAANFLAKVVKENDLVPKILVVHRYTEKMITNYQNISPLPDVQIVMHMDGWGTEARKKSTYEYFIARQPVQFTGFKLFYKNDVLEKGTLMMTPENILKLRPKPIYIQYQ